MSHDILFPQFGETTSEGKIVAWFKAVGDEVKEGDNLFEIESDKVSMEVPSLASGTLSEIRVPAGETAQVGQVIAVIGGQVGATAPKPQQAEPAVAPAAAPVPVGLAQEQPQPRQSAPISPFEEVSTPTESFGRAKGPLGLRISPLARRIIARKGVDGEAVARAVMADGRSKICHKDVLAALAETPASVPAVAPAAAPAAIPAKPVPAAVAAGKVVELNTIRRRTGERLTQNWQSIPHIFQAIDVDFSSIEAVRASHKARFKEENGVALTYLPFIARATCIALREFPQINAQFDGDKLTLLAEVNLGIAVDLAHNGLVVPVVHNAGDLTVPGLAKAIGRQIDKARSGKLTSDDFAGGTYSISNNGSFGTAFTVPIINAPQVAIMSTDAIRLRPAVVETAEGAFVMPRLVGTVGQSFDHRAFDGAYSAAFLSRLKDILEQRDWKCEFC